MRLFIGIEVPQMPKILELLELIKNSNAEIKLVEPYNIHITLLFLGEVRDDRVEDVKDSMKGLTFNTFKLSLEGLGAFPNITKPRVVWVGITGDIEELKRIRKYIYDELLKRKIRPEDEKEFVPHLTLGRVKGRIGNLIPTINENMNVKVGEISVSSLILFKSTLTPKGPIYEKIFEVKASDRRESTGTHKT
ncbi:MAG: RNA 2',3'-cyclic phosphodiesterase [Sulfolobaceae archaeon]|jgi:2'-5' RNA ligase